MHDLRDPAGPLAPPAGLRVLVGGGAAEVVDVVDRVAQDAPRAVLFILLTTYLVLFLLLRSVVLPLKALVMNTLSILASFGALVWIFQDGNLSALLDFMPLGFVETTMPVILFCVLFGLSMDYEVFLLTRMKEAWLATGDNRIAVAWGLERSGTDRDQRGSHRGARRGVVRVRRRGAHPGAGRGRRDRRGPRRDRGAGAPGAIHDAPAGPLELVDARGPAPAHGRRRRCSRHEPGAGARDPRVRRSRALLPVVALVLAGCGGPILARPGADDRGGHARPDARRDAPARPTARGAAA